MKKLYCGLMIVSSLTMSNMVNAADGTIKFKGNIVDSACSVDAASADQTVTLGTVAASSFAAAGDTSTAQKFDIKLTECPEGTVAVVFGGTAATADLLKLDAGMTATGVAVRINNSDDGTQIKVNDTASAKRVTVAADGSATLNYVGQYQATAEKVTAGTADATSQFTVLYN
ncbi:fimbrial protein [Atlantibacter sp.]|uniref:fimbrial protein n=1 Tax=Atlantibacter sp. TaxID=1903473 RepID=UPI0028AB2B7B|nr:fimbrial protein [Atlantibacter sp.]